MRSNLEDKNANYNTRKTEGICRTAQPVAQIRFDVADRMMLYSLDFCFFSSMEKKKAYRRQALPRQAGVARMCDGFYEKRSFASLWMTRYDRMRSCPIGSKPWQRFVGIYAKQIVTPDKNRDHHDDVLKNDKLKEMKKLTNVNPIIKALNQALRNTVVFSFLPNPIITQKQLFALIIKSPV